MKEHEDPCAGALPSLDEPFPPPPPEGGRLVMSWSGGKDSAMALHRLQRDRRYQVVGLMTTVSARYGRISHHGVRESLLDAQAASIGLPVHKLRYAPRDDEPEHEAMRRFEREMADLLAWLRQQDVFHIGFGDLFLQSTRRYREQRLGAVGMRAVFPLWGEPTDALLRAFTADGYQAVVTCAEPVAASLAGADLSADLYPDRWPDAVDPCGEHGEFHSFVHRGPVLRWPIAFTRGETVLRDGRHYTDLVPVPNRCP